MGKRRKSAFYFLGSLLAILFFASRIRVAAIFPLFFDEAIYIHWAQIVAQDWTWRFVSLIDGKQPLFIWLVSLSLRIIQDPVIVGRMVSILSGLAGMIGLFLLGKKLFGKKTGILASFLYLLCPFYLLYDSLALMDGLLSALFIYAVLFTIRFAKSMRIKDAVIVGVFAGFGLLTKSSAMFAIALLPLGLIFVKIYKAGNTNKYFLGSILALSIAKIIESILRFSVYFKIIAEKNSLFVKSFPEVLQGSISAIISNVILMGGWIAGYLGISLFLLAFVSFLYREKQREKLFILFYALIPICYMVLFGKQMYPRHFLFMVWPFLLLASYALVTICGKIKRNGLLAFTIGVVLFFYPVKNIYFLLTSPMNTFLPQIERWQFFEGEPSGIGITELYRFFDKHKNKKIVVITDKPIGILYDGIAIRYLHNPNVYIYGADQITGDIVRELSAEKKPDEIFLVTSWQEVPGNISVHLLKEIKREGKTNKNWRIYSLESTL